MKKSIAILAGTAAVVLTACGSSGSAPAPPSQYQQALAYSQCMRSHGEPGYPDPDSHGQILVTPADNVHIGSPALQAAMNACRALLPTGMTWSPAQEQVALGDALKLSACIRAHGVPDYPDPTEHGAAIELVVPEAMRDAPRLPAAVQACQSLLPDAGSGW